MDHNNRLCPICDKVMSYTEKMGMTWRCLNECFYESRASYGSSTIKIFDRKFDFSFEDHSSTWKKIDLDLANEVSRWKENDRYLAEILERQDRPKLNTLDFEIYEQIGVAVINKNAVVNVNNFFTIKKR